MDREDIKYYVGLAVSVLTFVVMSYNLKKLFREERAEAKKIDEIKEQLNEQEQAENGGYSPEVGLLVFNVMNKEYLDSLQDYEDFAQDLLTIKSVIESEFDSGDTVTLSFKDLIDIALKVQRNQIIKAQSAEILQIKSGLRQAPFSGQ